MDTIAAISTAQAVSAIGVLRLSGPDSLAIARAMFRPAGKGELQPRVMTYGTLLDRKNRPMDKILAVWFPGPGSYTGEDMVEFHCHGSPVVLREGLEAAFAAGARQALGGEFTKRAFLNGRLDLTQAEAVIDIIDAETADAARNAVGQLGGSLRRRIEGVYDALLDITSRFYAVVDYPDEDIEDLESQKITAVLGESRKNLEELLATYRRGQVLKAGVPTAILGRPNVGKSSLLNALLGFDRAIVTDVAGTTRDTVEEKALVGGVLLRLTDTAGLRETEDPVEKLGVQRSRAALEAAQLCLLVVDESQAATEEDREALALAKKAPHALVVVNKSDLPRQLDMDFGGLPQVAVSAKTGSGLDALERAVAHLFPVGAPPSGQLLTNPRQADALGRALEALTAAQEAQEMGLTPDAVLSDVENCLTALGELTGKTLREDLVARIFSRFCVGK